MKKFAALCLAVLMMTLCFAGCAQGSGSDLQDIRDRGKMVIGITESAPMNYRDDKGEWTGFDTDFARLVCEKLGVDAEFVILTDWGQKFYELKTRNIDAVWNGMTITEEAKLNASVTDAYVVNAQVVVMKKTEVGKYASVGDLKKLKMAVESGSAGEAILTENKFENVIALQDQASSLMEVASGTADACVVDITLANALAGVKGGYENLAVGMTLSTEEYGIAFRQNSDLTAEVNKLIAEMKQDGTLQKLADTYQLTLAD